MANKPKGGTATAIIILVMLGMMVFYMIMVYPQERQKLLRGNSTNVVAPNNAIFIDKNTYYVGNGKPAVNFNYTIKQLQVGDPLVKLLVINSESIMHANIIQPYIKYYSLNSNGSAGFEVLLNVSSTDGVIDIISGSTVVREIKSPGVYILNLPGSFSIKFSHTGPYFWTTQSANIKLKVYKEFYDDSNSKVTLTVPINDLVGQYFGMKFNANGSGIVTIYLNGNKVYSGVLTNDTNIQVSFDKAKLKPVNKITFVASKGSNYILKNLNFYLATSPMPALSKTYLINPVNSDVLIGLKVRILKPGELSIAIMPKGTVFFHSANDVQNGWNYFEVNSSFMSEAHGIKVFSIDGEYEIQEFEIKKV